MIPFPNLSALTDALQSDEAAHVIRLLGKETTKLTVYCEIQMTKERTRDPPTEERPYVTVRTWYNHEELIDALKKSEFDRAYIEATTGVIDTAIKGFARATANRVQEILEGHAAIAYPGVAIPVPMLDPSNMEGSKFNASPSPIDTNQKHLFGSDVFMDYKVPGRIFRIGNNAYSADDPSFFPAITLGGQLHSSRDAIFGEFKNLYEKSLQPHVNPPALNSGRGAKTQTDWTFKVSTDYELPRNMRSETWVQTNIFSTTLVTSNDPLLRALLRNADPLSDPQPQRSHKAPFDGGGAASMKSP